MGKLLVILGPTAIGKTDLALKLAEEFKGELIACDSRQIYKGLKIGAGKGEEKVWLYDSVDPNIRYSVSDYVKDAQKVIEDILSRDRLPIVVCGTGLYLKGLLGEFEDINIPPNPELRLELESLRLEELQSRVRLLSPTKHQSLNNSDRNNKRRLIRIIEQLNTNPYTNTNKDLKLNKKSWDVLKIGLSLPRPALNSKISSRIDSWFNQGLIKEAEELCASGLSSERMRDLGLEYRLLADYLDKKISLEDLKKSMKAKTFQYAKRQLTWFKKESDVCWFDLSIPNAINSLEKTLSDWYNSTL